MNKEPVPRGLVALGIVQLLSYGALVPSIFTKYSHVISFGQLVVGLQFKVLYVVQALLGLSIGIALLRVKKWGYVAFYLLTAYSVLSSLANIVLVKEALLLSAGWRPSPSMLRNYRIVMCFTIIPAAVMSIWLYAYRRHFKSANKAL